MKVKEDDLKQLIDDIQEFIEDFKKNSNGEISKISNKELLFFFINKCAELDKRMDNIEKDQVKTKTSIKNLLAFISVVGVICGILGYFGL